VAMLVSGIPVMPFYTIIKSCFHLLHVYAIVVVIAGLIILLLQAVQ
jgi:hypothetical protein